jgi:hypothetical protein
MELNNIDRMSIASIASLIVIITIMIRLRVQAEKSRKMAM